MTDIEFIGECLALQAVIVWIVDLSGFTEAWKGWLGSWLGVKVGRVRPLDCSLCAVWWALLAWALVRGRFGIPAVALSACLAFTADVTAGLLRLVHDGACEIISKLIDKLYK